ncbi:Hypothetical predicted protein [Octopus vulgaris]|uniref:Uncharacterized protein n=1 Tax=Octopus vulgaris TaxID=6645 RepID=A0AA36AU90_OCTVU|nr:Hypothetical predicted protein [Octopus vulgaris]
MSWKQRICKPFKNGFNYGELENLQNDIEKKFRHFFIASEIFEERDENPVPGFGRKRRDLRSSTSPEGEGPKLPRSSLPATWYFRG